MHMLRLAHCLWMPKYQQIFLTDQTMYFLMWRVKCQKRKHLNNLHSKYFGKGQYWNWETPVFFQLHFSLIFGNNSVSKDIIYMSCRRWDFVQVATCTNSLYKLQLVWVDLYKLQLVQAPYLSVEKCILMNLYYEIHKINISNLHK